MTVMSVSAFVACGSDSDGAGAASESSDPAVVSDQCLVRVHGRSDRGSAAELDDGRAILSPDGNAEFEDGFVWLYADPDDYEAARSILVDAVDAAMCRSVVLHGFSNGAAFVAKLVCRAETFDGRLIGAVIDDPVPDTAVVGCETAPDIRLALYWTGALSVATPGASCDDLEWTCDGAELLGIEAYATELGTEILDSPHDDHVWNEEAPELTAWFAS